MTSPHAWEVAYQQLLLEHDPYKVMERFSATERAMLDRFTEIEKNLDSVPYGELSDICTAADDLLKIVVRKLL
jgi:hypothetical protein